ncbi:PREDICTED: uncharacterized protein LOC104813264 [Tarenaya hassleriana]|uniref:uncharacterized protein LOC104813264 n=1 Tax=Tarenaya hassleriana TaxID=28532 RepID=UPI00053C73CE|nr:PREDICTED: uncharacterized protein LOC104813264 [Tarenaya hassleriana]
MASDSEDSTIPEVAAPNALDPYANPLYLHAADSSSISLVTDRLVDESNYNVCATSIVQILTAKNKLGFIFGTVPQPPEKSSDYGAWLRCNAMVGTWINNSVTPEVKSMIIYIPDAHKKWLTLETRYKQKNTSKKFHIEQQIELLQQGAMDLNAFFTKLNSLWEELKMHDPVPICTCGFCSCNSKGRLTEYLDKKNVVSFLMKLNESFHLARRQILMLDPLPDISRVYSMITQEAHQRQALPAVPDSVAFQAHSASAYRPRSSQPSKSRPYCTHCGLQGHTISRCYKLHGYPPGVHPSGNKSGLLPTPKLGFSDKTQPSVNMVDVETSGSQSSAVTSLGDSHLAQAQVLFDQFQAQLKGLSTLASDSNVAAAAIPSTTPLPPPGPYSGLDDWEG